MSSLTAASALKRVWGIQQSPDADVYVTSERFGLGPRKMPTVTHAPRISEVQWVPQTEDRTAWTSSELDAKHRQKAKLKQVSSNPPVLVRDPEARAAALSQLRQASEELGTKLLAPADAEHAARTAAAESAAAAAHRSTAVATRTATSEAGIPLLVFIIGGIGLLGLLLVAVRRT